MCFPYLILFLLCIEAIPESLLFNRVDVVNDIHKHVYIKLYAHSSETALIYTMVLFRSPRRQLIGVTANESHDHYHNALLIGSHTYQHYYKITKDSHFEYNNEIPLIARGVKFMIPFSIVGQREDWNRIAKTSYTGSSSGATLDSIDMYDTIAMDMSSSSATSYHAVLSMDKYSSIWDLYNIMTLTPFYITLRYEASGLVTDTVDEYGGLVKLVCDHSSNNSDNNDDDLLVSDRCAISTFDQLIMGDGTIYNRTAYRLIIDLHSAANYLPVHLYFHLLTLAASRQTITFIDHEQPSSTFILNNNIKYMLNEYDNDVIIGVDLLHLFPKVELSMESGEINLWYFDTAYVHNDRQEAVAITLTFLLIFCLYCYFEFISNEPGLLFQQLILYSDITSKWFYFSVRQVLIEILIMFLSTVIMLLTIVFAEYNTTYRFQRTVLLSILTFYHIIILTLVLFATPRVTKQAFKHYFSKKNSDPVTTTIDKDYFIVKDSYIEGDPQTLSKEQTINVIARNTCLINLIMLSIMMKVNFSSEDYYIYLLMLFVVALIFLYFTAHYVALGWIYWLTFASKNRKVPRSYLLFICGELGTLLFYVAWTVPSLYLDYFNAINSIYTETFIIAVTFTLISFVILFACRSYHSKVVDMIQDHYIAIS